MAGRLGGLLLAACTLCWPVGRAGQQTCPALLRSEQLSLAPSAAASGPPAPDPEGRDYRHQLRPTPAGWPVRQHWCVWIEPAGAPAGSAAEAREQRWLSAVLAGLEPWQELLSISLVNAPEQAQVRIWRRQPPLLRLPNGRTRASNGRAMLQLLLVDRGRGREAEPRVEVLLTPGRAPAALQATALHELGHAFGLWGHSDQPDDAMAAVPGPVPVLQLSPRDRATLQWLMRQDSRLQTPRGPSTGP